MQARELRRSQRFETRAEIDAYFAGDLLTCLLCGRKRRALVSHLTAAHNGMTADQYREKYGLPWRRGLVGQATFAKFSKLRERFVAENPESVAAALKRANAARKRRSNCRPPQPFTIRERHSTTWTAADAERMLEKIKKGLPPSKVYAMPGMPGERWWLHYRAENPEYNARVRKALDALPYSAQAPFGYGDRFRREVKACFDRGLSDAATARKLGVSRDRVNELTRQWRAKRKRRAGR
jgi:predicted transcriptional regulator